MPQKLDKASRGAYDAIIYAEGPKLAAEDANGRNITSGSSGDLVNVWNRVRATLPDYSTVILDGIDESISTLLDVTIDGLKIKGINGATIRALTSQPAIRIGSPYSIKSHVDAHPEIFKTTLLTADVDPSDATEFVDGGVHKYYYTVIPVADPSIVQAGDWILLASDVLWTYTSRTYPHEGELMKVSSVGASDVTVIGAAHDTYSVADGAKIVKVPLIEDVELQDIVLLGPDLADSYGIFVSFAHNLKMSNIRADLFQNTGICLYNVVDGIFDSLWFDGGFQSGAGYGVAVAGSSQDLNIFNVRGNKKRHVITVGSGGTYGLPRRINIAGCIATNGYQQAAFDVHHESEYVSYDNLFIDNYPVALNAYGVGSSFTNVRATNINIYGISTGNTSGAPDLLWPANIYNNFENIHIRFGHTGAAFETYLRCHQIRMRNVIFDGITVSSRLRDAYKFSAIDCMFISRDPGIDILSPISVNNAISEVQFIRCKFPGARDATHASIKVVSDSLRAHDIDIIDCDLGDDGGIGVSLYNGYNSTLDILMRNCTGPSDMITTTASWTYSLRPGSIQSVITYNLGSSTGTGSEQTIAHGLAAIPTGCKAWIKYLVGTRYITEMVPFDATNIYPTVETGVAYEWRIE